MRRWRRRWRWERRQRVEGEGVVPLTPAQVVASRASQTRLERMVSRSYVAAAALGTFAMGLVFFNAAPNGHELLITVTFAGAFLIAAGLVYGWSRHETSVPVAVLAVTTAGIVLTVSQVSAGISLESFLFGAAAMPYLLVRRHFPLVRAATSAGILGAYLVCEFAFPVGSGDAELPEALARDVTQFNRIGAGIFLFVTLAVIEQRHARTRRILEGAARYGELRATTDELTGVYNRRPVIAQLSEWAQRGRGNYAITLIDLDHFKQVNDEFGHDCGDSVLEAVATTLTGHFRDSDMVSRWGGDEFLVLIPGIRHADLIPVLERLRRSINLIEKHCGDHVHSVTVSIGAAMGATGQTPDECIAAADHALYRAKEEGRDRVVAVGVAQPTQALGRPSPDEFRVVDVPGTSGREARGGQPRT